LRLFLREAFADLVFGMIECPYKIGSDILIKASESASTRLRIFAQSSSTEGIGVEA
jgi:hypothetical protein